MAEKTVRLETGVNVWSIGQLEEAFLHAHTESVFDVFEWLRGLVESGPLLLTSDKGLSCRKAEAEMETGPKS